MDARRWALVVACLSLACSEPRADQAWTRITYRAIDDATIAGVYSIVQADPDANTCTRITIWQVDEHEDWIVDRQAQVEVEIDGVDDLVVYAAEVAHDDPPDEVDEGIAERCTNVDYPSDVGPPDPIVRGTLTFDRFRAGQPCRVSFDLSLAQYASFDPQTGQPEDLERFTARAEQVDLYAVGCPHPRNHDASHTELDAALGEVEGLATIVVSSYAADTGACVWARLLSSGASLPSQGAVEVPGAWVYSGVRVAQTAPEACIASALVDPDVDPGPSRSAGPQYSQGAVEFGAQQPTQTAGGLVDVPCTIDVDLALATFGEYLWIPDLVRMRDREVPVAGACE